MKRSAAFKFGLLSTAICIAGCVCNPPAEVEDRSFGSIDADHSSPASVIDVRVNPMVGSYRVERGDTLYSIAFKHGVDFRDLASWNRIDAPYRIFVGQELRLSRSGDAGAIVESTGVVTTHAAPDPSRAATVSALTPAPQASAAKSNSSAAVTPKPAVTANATSNVEKPLPSTAIVAATPVAKSATDLSAKPVPETPKVTPEVTKVAVEPGVATGFAWRWPGSGKVVGNFSGGDQTRQGIDIAGKAGDPVLAAADGDIVYSGNGLLGYGELVIIKHNANFLSAYGHNRKRLVQEGDKVKAGQQIAEMGSSASARDELHFEIRKNGKPVNPLDYLPAH